MVHKLRSGFVLGLVLVLVLVVVLVRASDSITANTTGIPNKTFFGTNEYYYSSWCKNAYDPAFVYLLGTRSDHYSKCQKVFPSSFSRDFVCSINFSIIPPGYALDGPLSGVQVDVNGLSSVPSAKLANLLIILIRRTASGVYYKYISNGMPLVGLETWSSSKIFAVADAGGKLEGSCSFGLDANASGKHGATPLGDLATVIASYDTSAGYTSNSLAKYFATVGGKSRLNDIVQKTLGRINETLGGSYGEPIPPDLGFSFSSNGLSCSVNPDLSSSLPNTISVLTSAELVRRIVMHREITLANRLPGLAWSDAQDILYGAANSSLYPGLQWGGMSSDISIFIQSRLNMSDLDARSKGKWRIFNKVGWGYSTSRGVGENRANGYACFPSLDASGHPIPNAGVEFVIAARSSAPGDTSLHKAQQLIEDAIADTAKAIVSGQIQ